MDQIVIGLEKLNILKKKKPKNHLCDKRTQNLKKKQTKAIWKKKTIFWVFPWGGAGSFLTFSPGGAGGYGFTDVMLVPRSVPKIWSLELGAWRLELGAWSLRVGPGASKIKACRQCKITMFFHQEMVLKLN